MIHLPTRIVTESCSTTSRKVQTVVKVQVKRCKHFLIRKSEMGVQVSKIRDTTGQVSLSSNLKNLFGTRPVLPPFKLSCHKQSTSHDVSLQRSCVTMFNSACTMLVVRLVETIWVPNSVAVCLIRPLLGASETFEWDGTLANHKLLGESRATAYKREKLTVLTKFCPKVLYMSELHKNTCQSLYSHGHMCIQAKVLTVLIPCCPQVLHMRKA